MRGFSFSFDFLVDKACHLLATAKSRLQPMEHGWKEHLSTLLPSKCLKPSPPTLLLTVCKCADKCDNCLSGLEFHELQSWPEA